MALTIVVLLILVHGHREWVFKISLFKKYAISRSRFTDQTNMYSLRSILPFINMDISRHILVLDTSVFTKDNMDRREYQICMDASEHFLQ
jgi:hypothetical protein